MAPVTLGYWNIRGLANPIRYLLEYTGTEYDEKRYVHGTDGAEWLKDKFNLGLEFPNVPYLIDGDIKLTQSNAILKYIARKHNLQGEGYKMDVLEGAAFDLLIKLAMCCYDPQFESKKEDFKKGISDILRPCSKTLGDKDWFAGKISYVDFMFYEYIWRYREFKPDCMNEFPNLEKYLERFENLSQIKNYMKSERFISYPFYLPFATYGGKPQMS